MLVILLCSYIFLHNAKEKNGIFQDVQDGKLVLITDNNVESREFAKDMTQKGVSFVEYNVEAQPEVLEYTKKNYGDLLYPTLIYKNRIERGMVDAITLLKSIPSVYDV